MYINYNVTKKKRLYGVAYTVNPLGISSLTPQRSPRLVYTANPMLFNIASHILNIPRYSCSKRLECAGGSGRMIFN